ncbi:MAG: protease [candidate division Zixibacteria bacterium]|nr:protease [candidate division Zixibacteria bacterium]NIR62596.1 protease [candidate division Zixibacteria bacterium]NIS15927.1 protease [candidate division Zixibacteria bacterium]NIS44708.1 protease [candidate division Zixibacteria bacterium]NIT51919.1 protease [candidate division Zixibacteria bacterium]
MSYIHKLCINVFIILILSGALLAEDRLFRFPDVSEDMVAFSYAGDIWTVDIEGGLARRITTDKGLELFPKFSPDGQKIAFTGQYDGNTHVYYMPAEGGEPVRLTFHPAIANTSERMGPEHVVMDWTSDGDRILFRSRRHVLDVWLGKLMLVDTAGGLPEELPLPHGGFTSFAPDGLQIAYCPIYRDFRTWKRYKGGMAQDVYIYDLKTYEQKKITDWIGTDNMPMWAGEKIYFNSDRTGRLNLYAYDINSGQINQVTDFTEYDVRWPSLGPKHIVFENGGYLYLLDLASEEVNKISITHGADRELVRPEYVNVSDNIIDYSLSPDGKRVVMGARGEVFTVPAERGNIRNLTKSNGVYEKYSVWSPDGKYIAYVSDETGEDEIYIIPQDGKGDGIKLSNNGEGWLFHPRWSHDSKKIAFADANTNLLVLDVNSREVTVADAGEKTGIHDYSWSPDSRWLAYTKIPDKTSIRSIFLYSLDDNQVYRITPGITNDYSPVFDPDGKYLYFFSDRNFNAETGGYEFNFVYNAMTGIYAMILSEGERSPFAPESDEVGQESKEDEKDKERDKKRELPSKIDIDLKGLSQREIQIPIQPGDYHGLEAMSGRIYYFSYPFRGLSGPKSDEKRELRYFDMDKKKDQLFMEDVAGFALSADESKILMKAGDKYIINDAEAEKGDPSSGILDLTGMDMYLDRKAEYEEMFDDAWRRYRDFFYDSNMHGVDWKAMYGLYKPLVKHASHRYDLTYIIGELAGELACSHTYVGGGDYSKPESDKIALLGIEFEADTSANLFRIGRIYDGKNWEERLRSPLKEPGIKAEEGHYIFEIDGQRLTANINPYSLLVNKADRIVTLKISPTADEEDAYEIEVDPIDNEQPLWYYNWVERKRAIVDSLSDGRIGYIHIPDMGSFGLNQFARQFYHLYKKEGLVIDVRFNGGGFVSQLALDRLRRVVVGMGAGRHDWVGTYPSVAFHGHMACLINQYSCSDGDIFPYYFREYGLGPLIGVRTWGGVIGIGGFRPLMDGGYVTVPGGGSFSLEGDWIMENVGVEPDIEIEQDPALLMQGRDPQLERSVEYVMEKIRTEPKTLLDKPGPPEERKR